ncbi:MAG TPA: AAA family ATPase [Streptosporangiaceae bacterium]|nr:AAA family ATPase [Streptosporangiaceae bacterium]
MANHEQDQTAGTGPAGMEPDAPETGLAGQDEGGTFRWPSGGLPRFFGQQSAAGDDVAMAGPPGPAPGVAGGWSQSLGINGQPPETREQPGAGGQPAGREVRDTGPEPAGNAEPEAGAEPYAAEPYGVGPYHPAGEYSLTDGYGTVGAYGQPTGFDPPDEDPLAEYDVAVPAGPAPAPPPLPRAEPPDWQHTETADSLTADLLLPGRRAAPPGGWRRVLYRASGGLVRASASSAEMRRRELVSRASTPVATGHHRVAVLSLKGGVGKTTTVMGLGSTLASLRGDRVIAVDANPDRGTLSDKLRLETAATVRDLLDEREQILRYADVRAYTTQAPSRLEVLASDRDPTVSVAFSDTDYEDVAQVLEHYYSVCITDCGTGLLHSAMAGVLRLADQIVLVSSPSVDGARSASATLDWLQAHGYGDLVRDAVVVLSVVRPRSKSTVDLGRLEQHFATRCRAVVRIPYDAHLEEGAEVDLAQLSRPTADAYLQLAAEVGDGFSWPHRVSAASM